MTTPRIMASFSPQGRLIVIALRSLLCSVNSTMCVHIRAVWAWVNACARLLWAFQSDFPARVRFIARSLRDESSCLIEQPHGGLPVSALMSIQSNRWSITSLRARGIRLFACKLLLCCAERYFKKKKKNSRHSHSISWLAALDALWFVMLMIRQP